MERKSVRLNPLFRVSSVSPSAGYPTAGNAYAGAAAFSAGFVRAGNQGPFRGGAMGTIPHAARKNPQPAGQASLAHSS